MKSGIYQITNIINNHRYIGSSSAIFQRWNKHRFDLRKNKHHSIYLQRAWNKYGAENFLFEVLELCNPNECLSIEQSYLDRYEPEYNLAKNSNAPTLGQKLSIETRDKMSRSQRGLKRPPRTEEHRKNLGQAISKKQLGQPCFEIRRTALVRSHVKFCKQVDKIDPITGIILDTFQSVTSIKLKGYSPSGVSQAINGRLEKYKGYLWTLSHD